MTSKVRREGERCCPRLLLVHLPDRLHHQRGEQGRHQPVVRHQVHQSSVEIGNVAGLRLDHPRQGQQVELVLLPVQVVVQMLYILLMSGGSADVSEQTDLVSFAPGTLIGFRPFWTG